MDADPGLLPSQIFTTAAALMDCVDKQVVVVLRDGRKLFGIMRSFDQYGNFVLQGTVERIYASNDSYADLDRGVFLIRGENVVLMGELDFEKQEANDQQLKKIPVPEALAAQKLELEQRKNHEKIKNDKLRQLAFTIDPFQKDDQY